MSKNNTPAQKRRAHFHQPEDWARWVCAIIVAEGGTLTINRYSWKTSTTDIERGVRFAKKLGWVVNGGGPPSAYSFVVTDSGREAAKLHRSTRNIAAEKHQRTTMKATRTSEAALRAQAHAPTKEGAD